MTMRRLLHRLSLCLAPLALAASASADTIAFDDLDGGDLNLTSRVITPDLSGSSIPGTFSNRFDVFGLVDRNVNFDFADDSAGSFPADTFGVLKTGHTGNVFGVEDIVNPDNASGTGSATWTFDISGASSLSALLIDFAAMGDFEANNDIFSFSASIDGGTSVVLFASSVDEAGALTYTLESGTTRDLNDPLQINGTTLSNNFQTLSASLAGLGTGNLLTLSFSATADGGSEVFAFDNITIDGTFASAVVPEPASALLALPGLAGLAYLARRRRLAS
jgi:hypothetical protein